MDFLWPDNSNSGNSVIDQGAYRDNKNSPYAIIDKDDIDVSANDSGVTRCTSFHKAKWTASNGIYREDQIVTLIVTMTPRLKKMTIDFRANVTVPGPVERQHD